jgi:hypothetical protein
VAVRAPDVLWCIAIVLVAELVYKFVIFAGVSSAADGPRGTPARSR